MSKQYDNVIVEQNRNVIPANFCAIIVYGHYYPLMTPLVKSLMLLWKNNQ